VVPAPAPTPMPWPTAPPAPEEAAAPAPAVAPVAAAPVAQPASESSRSAERSANAKALLESLLTTTPKEEEVARAMGPPVELRRSYAALETPVPRAGVARAVLVALAAGKTDFTLPPIATPTTPPPRRSSAALETPIVRDEDAQVLLETLAAAPVEVAEELTQFVTVVGVPAPRSYKALLESLVLFAREDLAKPRPPPPPPMQEKVGEFIMTAFPPAEAVPEEEVPKVTEKLSSANA